MRDEPRVEPLGDRAVVVRCGDAVDDATFRRVQAVRARIMGATPAGTTDVVAGFTSVALHFDPLLVRRADGVLPTAAMTAAVAALVAHLDAAPVLPGRTFEIPVCYEGDMAPDLGEVARHTGLAADEVIAIHSAAEYVVRVVGFLPGFSYLGGLDPRLVTPRRDTPRRRVPAGSVGIGGAQTGIYPLESPGGWNIIGRTDARLFVPQRTPPALLAVGDRVRFRPVPAGELAKGVT